MSGEYIPHVVTAYENELRGLEEGVSKLGEAAARQIENAVSALVTGDVTDAQRIIAQDKNLDALVAEAEGACIRILALRQPHADDLRLTVSTIKACSEVERAGDYAKNIAKRIETIASLRPVGPMRDIPYLMELAVGNLRKAVGAFVTRDPGLAGEVWKNDAALDAAYTAIFRDILTYMAEDSQSVTACTHLLFIAKNLERVGDRATNIAEHAYYLATGRQFEGERPKSDLTSSAVPAALDGAEE
ncbi:phosphate signaling complex protein PhoU [Telmatospirillum sp. J64-1]|uniref:phosphate signaling complex protein PhoU n=1 Tax=Telmatospirillum sp. J64-1 TaxID=2502183 RepID=UPI00115DCF5D|nr:phosphate signaling complex protein PhoU [Telmatospirillum sp. J64-1]